MGASGDDGSEQIPLYVYEFMRQLFNYLDRRNRNVLTKGTGMESLRLFYHADLMVVFIICQGLTISIDFTKFG